MTEPSREAAIKLLRSRRYLVDAVDRRQLSTREIAAELGVHHTSVREHMRRQGIAPVIRPDTRA